MRLTVLSLVCVVALSGVASAQGKATVAREAAEYVLGRFGKEAAKEGLEGLARKIELLAIKHGDEAIVAVRKVGPGAFRLVEDAGEHGLDAIKIMAKYGDDAVWVVAKKNRMAIFVKYGDNAGAAMMKHGEVVEPLLALQRRFRPKVITRERDSFSVASKFPRGGPHHLAHDQP